MITNKITLERETLLPCPFCGGEAEILTIPEDHPDAGAMFVQCCDSRCMTSSALLYPLMGDVRALLVERWNRRAAPAAQSDERIRVLREALEVAKNGLGWWQESCPDLVTECDHEAMTQIDAALEVTK